MVTDPSCINFLVTIKISAHCDHVGKLIQAYTFYLWRKLVHIQVNLFMLYLYCVVTESELKNYVKGTLDLCRHLEFW